MLIKFESPSKYICCFIKELYEIWLNIQKSMIYTINKAILLMTIDMLEISLILFYNCDDSYSSFLVLSIRFHQRSKIVFGYPSCVPCTADTLVQTTFWDWNNVFTSQRTAAYSWAAWTAHIFVDTRVFHISNLFFSVPTTGARRNIRVSTVVQVVTKIWCNKYGQKKGDGKKLHFLKAFWIFQYFKLLQLNDASDKRCCIFYTLNIVHGLHCLQLSKIELSN